MTWKRETPARAADNRTEFTAHVKQKVASAGGMDCAGHSNKRLQTQRLQPAPASVRDIAGVAPVAESFVITVMQARCHAGGIMLCQVASSWQALACARLESSRAPHQIDDRGAPFQLFLLGGDRVVRNRREVDGLRGRRQLRKNDPRRPRACRRECRRGHRRMPRRLGAQISS